VENLWVRNEVDDNSNVVSTYSSVNSDSLYVSSGTATIDVAEHAFVQLAAHCHHSPSHHVQHVSHHSFHQCMEHHRYVYKEGLPQYYTLARCLGDNRLGGAELTRVEEYKRSYGASD